MKIIDEIKILLRYGFLGICMTMLGTFTIFFFMSKGLNPLISNFFGYLITIFISFFLNKVFVFRSKKNEFGKFSFFFLSAYLINVLFLFLGSYLSLNPFLSQSIAIFSYAISMYFFLRIYVFNDAKLLMNFSK